MKKSIGLILLVFSMVAFARAGTPVAAKDARTPEAAQESMQSSPLPSPVSQELSKRNTPIPYPQKSTVFKKKSNRNQADANLGLEGYFHQGSYEGREKFYNQLNAELFSSFSSKPKALTPEEKFWGTVSTIAGYGMAAGAAAQALGIIPDEKAEKEKKKKK
jgi:hypothetical protein